MVYIYTSQYKYKGNDRLDITAKSIDPIGQIFAPSWYLIMKYKNSVQKLSDQNYYTDHYIQLMRQSYKIHFKKWQWLLNQNEITLVCFCRANTFCHRYILVNNCLKPLGVKYLGEKL